MFRVLAAHPGPHISAAAAASLAGLSPARTRSALGELVSASLLIEHASGRYRMHDLVRAYAADQRPEPQPEPGSGPGSGPGSEPASERLSAQARLGDHYLHTAYAGTMLLAPVGHPIILDPVQPGVLPERLADHSEALAWLKSDLPVLLAAVELAAVGGLTKQTRQLPCTSRRFLTPHSLFQHRAAAT